MIRAVAHWNEEYGQTSLAERQQVMRAQLGLRDLNETVSQLADSGNLLHKVFSKLLTQEQTAALRASHLTWISDYAFAIDPAPKQRQALKELVATKALLVPPVIDQETYCRHVLDSIPIEELEATCGAELAKKLKSAWTEQVNMIPLPKPLPKPFRLIR